MGNLLFLSNDSPSATSLQNPRSPTIHRTSTIEDFVRFRRKKGDKGYGELQTAVVRYRKKFPRFLLQPYLRVDLVSMVHLADKEYFANIQKYLEQYDCVLYEMLTNKKNLKNMRNQAFRKIKKKKAPSAQGFDIYNFVEQQIACILKLEFQVDCLVYNDDNWYHADLDYETFKSLQLERGETLLTFARDMTLIYKRKGATTVHPGRSLTMKFKLLWDSIVELLGLYLLIILFIIIGICALAENKISAHTGFVALFRLDFRSAMKVFVAKMLSSQNCHAATDERSVLIGERNRVAMETLQRVINVGHRRIAILYGGAHMPDLDRRLRKELKMVPKRSKWLTAWSIKKRGLETQSRPLRKTSAKSTGQLLVRFEAIELFVFFSFIALGLCSLVLFFRTVVNWALWAASIARQFCSCWCSSTVQL